MDEEQRSRSFAQVADTVIMYVEMVIYAVVCCVLVLGAVALLIESVKSFFEDLDDGVLWAATQMLSVLLLVFVFVELLGAVRSRVRGSRARRASPSGSLPSSCPASGRCCPP